MTPHSKKSAVKIHDLVMYLAVLVKHLRLILLLACFSMLCGLSYYSFARCVFHSKSYVQYQSLERPRTSIDAEKVFHDSSDLLIIKQLGSSPIVRRAARRLGVNEDYDKILKEYLRKVTVTRNAERNLEIDVWAFSQQWAAELARLLVEEYLQNRDERRLEMTRVTIESFNKELAEIRTRMDQSFDQKFSFRNTNELTQIMIQLNSLKEVPRDLYIAKYRLGLMDDAREILSKQTDPVAKLSLLESSAPKSRLSLGQVVVPEIPATSEDDTNRTAAGPIVVVPQMTQTVETWEDLERQRRQLQSELQQLGQVFKDGHPKMIERRKRLAAIDKALEFEVETAVQRFELEYANLKDRVQALENKLPAYDEIMRRHQKYLRDYSRFDAGQLTWTRMQADLQKSLESLDYGNDKERCYLRFISTDLDEDPVSPGRLRLFAYSILMALCLCIAIPFLIEYLDNRVSDVDEVEATLRIRGLGVVPKLGDDDSEGLLLLGDKKPDYHLQENFRVIRTNLVLNSETATLPQVILITSAMPQEGKTVVASNLAISFAMKGEKTLLVDGDLRRGRMHRMFAAHNKPGMSDILRDQRPIEEGFRSTGHENLTLLTCGKHLNSASELLDSPSFARMLDDLRQRFQRIIIDSPPVLGLAETSIIQRLADGVLFVIWSDFTPIRNVKAAIQALQGNGAKFSGFVLNRLDFHSLGNRYRYFYYAPNYYTNYKAIEAPAVIES